MFATLGVTSGVWLQAQAWDVPMGAGKWKQLMGPSGWSLNPCCIITCREARLLSVSASLLGSKPRRAGSDEQEED